MDKVLDWVKLVDIFATDYMLHHDKKHRKKLRSLGAVALTATLVGYLLWIFLGMARETRDYTVIALNEFTHERSELNIGEGYNYRFPTEKPETKDFFMAFALSPYDQGGPTRFDDPDVVSLVAYYHAFSDTALNITKLDLRPCTL